MSYNEQDKKAIDNKISDSWLNVFISYAELCNQDKSLKETVPKINRNGQSFKFQFNK